jgi:hypothetical protein
MNKCRLCYKNSLDDLFSEKILNKYIVKFFLCKECKSIQSDEPFWLEESYIESINLSDTGILQRNIALSKIMTILFFFLRLVNKKRMFLDFGGGYGLFTRLMRDVGFDYYWEDTFSKNYLARGFEGEARHYDLITCFEVFEHLANPHEVIANLTSRADAVVFTTLLYGDTPPDSKKWEYYSFSHGQHIHFYNINTLKYIAKDVGLNLLTDGKNIHILSKRKIPKYYLFFSKVLYKLGIFNFLKKLIYSKTIKDSIAMKNKE